MPGPAATAAVGGQLVAGVLGLGLGGGCPPPAAPAATAAACLVRVSTAAEIQHQKRHRSRGAGAAAKGLDQAARDRGRPAHAASPPLGSPKVRRRR